MAGAVDDSTVNIVVVIIIIIIIIIIINPLPFSLAITRWCSDYWRWFRPLLGEETASSAWQLALDC